MSTCLNLNSDNSVMCTYYLIFISDCLLACTVITCCFFIVCRRKSPTGLMLHRFTYSTLNKSSMSTALKGTHFHIFFITILMTHSWKFETKNNSKVENLTYVFENCLISLGKSAAPP